MNFLIVSGCHLSRNDVDFIRQRLKHIYIVRENHLADIAVNRATDYGNIWLVVFYFWLMLTLAFFSI